MYVLGDNVMEDLEEGDLVEFTSNSGDLDGVGIALMINKELRIQWFGTLDDWDTACRAYDAWEGLIDLDGWWKYRKLS
jgi:hypothetical protein